MQWQKVFWISLFFLPPKLSLNSLRGASSKSHFQQIRTYPYSLCLPAAFWGARCFRTSWGTAGPLGSNFHKYCHTEIRTGNSPTCLSVLKRRCQMALKYANQYQDTWEKMMLTYASHGTKIKYKPIESRRGLMWQLPFQIFVFFLLVPPHWLKAQCTALHHLLQEAHHPITIWVSVGLMPPFRRAECQLPRNTISPLKRKSLLTLAALTTTGWPSPILPFFKEVIEEAGLEQIQLHLALVRHLWSLSI